MPLLEVRNLSISRHTQQGWVQVLDRVNLTVKAGQIHTLCGESGSGKSLIAKAIMGFLGQRWQIRADRLHFDGHDLQHLKPRERRAIIGVEVAMIFQDAKSYLDPNNKVGEQVREAILDEDLITPWWQHYQERTGKTRTLLAQVGIADPDGVMDSYPFEISEGVAQKVLIASALAHRPQLLIADEPTTMMEPETQQQIYRLLASLQQRHDMSILLMTQDLTSILPETQQLSLIYSGQVMESGPTQKILETPWHPYTEALLQTSLQHQASFPAKTRLPTLPGTEPSLHHLPIGCRLGPRCPNAQRECVRTPRMKRHGDRWLACHYPLTNPEGGQHD